MVRPICRVQVTELLGRLAGLPGTPVAPTLPSPRQYHYRAKLTPAHPPLARTAISLAFTSVKRFYLPKRNKNPYAILIIVPLCLDFSISNVC